MASSTNNGEILNRDDESLQPYGELQEREEERRWSALPHHPDTNREGEDLQPYGELQVREEEKKCSVFLHHPDTVAFLLFGHPQDRSNHELSETAFSIPATTATEPSESKDLFEIFTSPSTHEFPLLTPFELFALQEEVSFMREEFTMTREDKQVLPEVAPNTSSVARMPEDEELANGATGKVGESFRETSVGKPGREQQRVDARQGPTSSFHKGPAPRRVSENSSSSDFSTEINMVDRDNDSQEDLSETLSSSDISRETVEGNPHHEDLSSCSSDAEDDDEVTEDGTCTLRKMDVIWGRSNALTEKHPGNRRFRRIIDMHRANYQSIRNRKMKASIVDEILDRINSRGRFLKKSEHPNGSAPWVLAKDAEAEEKVRKALRRGEQPRGDQTQPPPPSRIRSSPSEGEDHRRRKKARTGESGTIAEESPEMKLVSEIFRNLLVRQKEIFAQLLEEEQMKQ